MSKYSSLIESLLLIAGKPLVYSAISKALDCSTFDIKEAVKELSERYNTKESGIHLMINNNKVQLTTNPDNKKMIADYMKDETSGELTKPSLETLTIIAYRQPVTKEEIEQIRGVNCSLILRNLMIRGLIEAKEDRGGLTTNYSVTMDFLRFLGLNTVEELPDFAKLHEHESLQTALEKIEEKE